MTRVAGMALLLGIVACVTWAVVAGAAIAGAAR